MITITNLWNFIFRGLYSNSIECCNAINQYVIYAS